MPVATKPDVHTPSLTIKQVAERVGESPHTIRYYCKEGLFPFLTRSAGGVRLFSEADMEGVEIVLCLRDTGMPLAEIRHYMELGAQGDSTIPERLEIIRAQKAEAERALAEAQARVDHLAFKERNYVETLAGLHADECNPITTHNERKLVRARVGGHPTDS